MSNSNRSLAPLLDRLGWRVTLSDADRDAVLCLPHGARSLRTGEYFVRQGEVATHCCLMVSGFTIRDKIMANGKRQILAVHMKGDTVDLQNALLERSDHNVQALTAAEVVTISRPALEELAFARPNIGKAMWLETLVDGSVFREWIANIGRRNARARMAHLLCEFAVRFEKAGLGTATSYDLPMSQEQLADAVGLTPVHVNRTLKLMGEQGLIERNKRSVRIHDWGKLATAGDFDQGYLHLPSIGRAPNDRTMERLTDA